jgi:hypothetical protein
MRQRQIDQTISSQFFKYQTSVLIMGQKRRAEDAKLIEDPEPKRQRQSQSLATRYLLLASSSPWISMGETTDLSLMLQQKALPIREYPGTSLMTSSGNESADHYISVSHRRDTAVSAQGIASFVTEDGTPTLLSSKYLNAARLAAGKCRDVSDEVYDVTLAISGTGRPEVALNKGYFSKNSPATNVGEASGIISHAFDSELHYSASHGNLQQTPQGRMTACEQVFSSHRLVEQILLAERQSGSPTSSRRLQGVSKSFRHVLKRSTKLRKLGSAPWMG